MNKEKRVELGPPPATHPPLPWVVGKATETWYETWATSPQASRFTPTDWQRLHMMAPLVDAYFEAPSKDLMTEIRLNEALLGATEADRLRLRWDLKPGTQPTPITSRKKPTARLRVVADGPATGTVAGS